MPESMDHAQRDNESRFQVHGKHALTTIDQARALANACGKGNIDLAAGRQYDASRDAWVSYLAQTKYGAVGAFGTYEPAMGPEVMSQTTNMMTQPTRDAANVPAPGFIPPVAPSFADAARGHAPGVLVVMCKLPAIRDRVMEGRPTVKLALLNGVNKAIRDQYSGQSLSNIHIPRHIDADVEGAPNFTVNLDESDAPTTLSPRERPWLVARAMAAGVAVPVGEAEHARLGLRLLLDDLVTGEIRKQLT